MNDINSNQFSFIFPEKNTRVNLNIDYSIKTCLQLINLIKQEFLSFPAKQADWDFHAVDSDGWSTIIDDHAPISSFVDKIVYLRRQRSANIGGRFLLQHLQDTEKFNQHTSAKVSELKRSYIGYRQIRGDGNCYYRAVIYGLIEILVEAEKFHIFNQLAMTLLNVDSVQQGNDSIHFSLVVEKFTSIAEAGKYYLSLTEINFFNVGC